MATHIKNESKQVSKTTAARRDGRHEKGKPQYGTRRKDPAASEQAMGAAATTLSWVKTIVSSLLIVMVINGLLIASFVVPTGSMENEVMAGDFLFVNKFLYGGSTPQTIPFLNTPLPFVRLPGLRDPERGDVIVFIFPGNRDEIEPETFQYFLKRCIAVAGDTLEVRGGLVFVNGVQQPIPPNAKFEPNPTGPQDHLKTFPEYRGFTRDNWGPIRIPREGDVFPLNDSTVSSYRVFIAREGHQIDRQGEIILIDGKPATTYRVERDYVFGMGDNRNNSEDSRYFGFIPKENVVGTPLIVYWSWDPNYDFFTELGEKLGSIRWSRIFTTIN